MSLLLRDQYIRACWVPADFRQPPTNGNQHHPVRCWGVVSWQGHIFQEIVHWWPALRVWTCTMQVSVNEDAQDIPVTVLWWQPMPPLPNDVESAG